MPPNDSSTSTSARTSTRQPSQPTAPQTHIDTFANPRPDRDYEIRFECPEFTCLCPLTGQPDFATIRISYVPDQLCVELKSLKLFLWSFRDRGAFHEEVTNQILDEIATKIRPRRMTVTGEFWVRGGIKTDIAVSYPHTCNS